MPLEFRVRWRREHRNPTYRIYQDWNTACRKVRSILAMDQIKDDTERFADMPDIAEIEIQFREVGEWQTHAYKPEATESDRDGLKSHIYYRYGEGAPKDPPLEPLGDVPF